MGASAPINYLQAESGLAQIASGLSFFHCSGNFAINSAKNFPLSLLKKESPPPANDHLSRITAK